MSATLNIVIADDHPLMVVGIRELLEQDANIRVLAAERSPTALMAALETELPDIIITDYNMPDDERFGDGIQFVKHLLRRYPTVKVLVLTMLSNPLILASLYDAGVHGVMLKQHDLNEVIKAVHIARLGNRYYPPGYTYRPPAPALADDAAESHPADRFRTLSPREFEVLRLFSQGHTISDIAEHLHRSIKTVSTQKITAMRKLGVSTNQELITYCVQHGIFLN
ncbi:response regulator [Kerstersia sp.]|uniref:response regulator n=1 Tax=Kerstersia sp. TaxID=1930783 RepID=UPI003F905DFF